MDDQLLIRAYDVGVGDCLYVRIPKARKKGSKVDDFHILIDCGTIGGETALKTALAHLKTQLPEEGPQRRLDLLLITHEHKDHFKGMNPAWFEDVRIENLWMSVAMDRNHPQATFAHQLHDLATDAMLGIAARGLALSPELEEIVNLYGIDNKGAVDALRNVLPQRNGIKPLYVHADLTAPKLRPSTLQGATFKVLAPEYDIDRYYLGKGGAEILHGLAQSTALAGPAPAAPADVPSNISGTDFRRLRSRMMSSAFAFAQEAGEVVNNTSVVLLIEWRGRRLLFVGDAEWNRTYSEGERNFSWNTAWKLRRAKLGKPVDFLKIGHHGSVNATPWNDKEDGQVTEPGSILDAILPLPAGTDGPSAQAIVSTARTNVYESIPRAGLLVEIGRRVRNTRNYEKALGTAKAAGLPHFAAFEKASLGKPQPLRTDLETRLGGKGFVDVLIDPKT